MSAVVGKFTLLYLIMCIVSLGGMIGMMVWAFSSISDGFNILPFVIIAPIIIIVNCVIGIYIQKSIMKMYTGRQTDFE